MVTRDQIKTLFDVFEPPERDGRRFVVESNGDSEPRIVAGDELPWEKTGSMTLIELMHILEPKPKLNS